MAELYPDGIQSRVKVEFAVFVLPSAYHLAKFVMACKHIGHAVDDWINLNLSPNFCASEID